MYQSKYYTCEEIDERLLKGYYDDAVSKGYSDTFEQFKVELASIKDIAKNKESIQSNASAINANSQAILEEIARAQAAEQANAKDIERIRQSTGISNIPIFDETKDYAVGDIVNYEGRILKFHRYHSAGPMIFAEVDSATVMDTRIVQKTGGDEDVVMSQAAVSRELARTSHARIDDIVESATIIDVIEMEPEAIVYVKDQKVFAARKGSEFSRYWTGDEAYMTSEGEIQKDKLYTFNGAVYCWDIVSESLVPSYSLLEAKTPNQIRTHYSNDGVSVDLYHNDKLLWSDTIEPATESSAGVMSAADKVMLVTLLHKLAIEEKTREEADTAINARVDKSLSTLDSSYEEESVTIYGYSDKGNNTPIANADINAATHDKAGVMSSADKTALDALALYNAKSVISVDGMDFSLGDILEILKGHRPTRYAVKYVTETSSYVCGIVDVYTSRDGRMFTEIYTGGCNLAVDYTGGTHDSSKIYQFMRQYRIVGSGTPAEGTWSTWRSCLSTEAMEELYAMGLDYKVYEDLEDGYIEVKLTGRDGGVVGGSTEIPFASPEKSGFMSKEDKKKLDGIEEGADKTKIVQEHGTDEKAVMSQAAVTQADEELLLRIQGRSADSVPYYDPFKYVKFEGTNYLTEFNNWIDSLHTTDGSGDPSKAGFFRVSLWGMLLEVKNPVISWERNEFHQVIIGNIGIDGNGKISITSSYNTVSRKYSNGAWSEWRKQDVSDEIKDTIADGIRTEYSENKVSLSLLHGQSRLFGDAISAATQEKAGVMSAEDKKKLDEMRNTVVFTGATVDEETEMLVLNRVDEETLVLDEVNGTLPGGITKVSQLENDKGYLTGTIEEESIMLNND